jgi:fido (protein-threonine AMPylation protein)
MAYIYKKIVEGKPYYYLRISERVKSRVISKDIAYLGTDPNKIESKLEELPKKYAKDIRKAYRNIQKFVISERLLNKVKGNKMKSVPFLTRDILEEIESIKLHYNQYFLKENPLTIKEVYKEFLIDFAYNTTSMEGNTITLKETEKLLQENLTPKNRTLREIYDLQNTEKVFFEILDSNKQITHDFIIWIHDNLMENIDNRKGYRIGESRVARARFKSTPAKYVKADMGILLKWYKKNKKKIHPLALASIFHQKFERIHPFSDGNGRTGRILVLYILMRLGYSPVIIHKKNRSLYLDALSKGDKVDLDKIDEKAFTPIVEFVSGEVIGSYWNYFLV